MFYLSAALIFVIDQATKYLIAMFLRPGQSWPLIKGILHLTYVQNRGAAFGLFYGKQGFLVLAGIILLVVIFYYYFRLGRSNRIAVPLGLMVGGSLGNIFDRIVRHFVVDFIDVRFWPVFNMADAMINIGVFLVMISLLFSKEKQDVSDPA